MADPKWQSSLDTLKQQLQGLNVAAGAAVPESVLGIFRQSTAEKWSGGRLVFTYGQLDPDLAIPCCRAGLIPWWTVVTGRAAFADPAGLKKVLDAWQQDPGPGAEKLNLDPVLTWTTIPYTFTDGVTNKFDARIARELFERGADPNHDNGAQFDKALRNMGAEAIGAFLDHGGAAQTAYRVLDELLSAKNTAQAAKIQEAVAARSLYAKLDDQTLAETKYVPGPEGGGVFKTLFNFRARRVNEIYEYGHDRKAVMNGISFDEYDGAALQEAEDRLRQLGGKPRAAGERLDKPKKPQLG